MGGGFERVRRPLGAAALASEDPRGSRNSIGIGLSSTVSEIRADKELQQLYLHIVVMAGQKQACEMPVGMAECQLVGPGPIRFQVALAVWQI